jgi:hypothetical protein
MLLSLVTLQHIVYVHIMGKQNYKYLTAKYLCQYPNLTKIN